MSKNTKIILYLRSFFAKDDDNRAIKCIMGYVLLQPWGVSHATLHELAPRYGKDLLAIGAVLEHSPSPLARR